MKCFKTAAACFFCMGTLVLPTFFLGCPDTPPEDAKIPDVLGMEEQAAIASIQAAGFAQGNYYDEFSEAAPPGTVIAQDPEAGTCAEPGTPVHLTISQGSVFDAAHYTLDHEWDQATYNWGTPVALAVDSAGNLFVMDHNRVVAIDANGDFVQEWGEAGHADGQFDVPYAVDVTEADRLYFADTHNRRAQVFTRSGQHIASYNGYDPVAKAFQTFRRTFGIVGTEDGRMLIVDADNNRVVILNADGSYVNDFNSRDNGGGGFSEPFGIDIDETTGDIFVGDTYNNLVQRFDATGQFINNIGSGGSGPGEFNRVQDVAVDDGGNVYAADQYNHRIQKFTADGVFITAIGQAAGTDSGLNRPHGVDVDGQGYVYIADSVNHRVVKFAPQLPPRS